MLYSFIASIDIIKTWNGLENRLANGLSKFLRKASLYHRSSVLVA